MKLQRPPFVLAHLADLAGCGFHRIMRPLQIMGRNGIITGRAESQFLPDAVLKGIRPDVVVWQRQCDENHVETIKRYRAALPDAYFVYEIDDAMSAVPDKSWHKPYMAANIDERTAIAVALCDVVTVTTQDLADHMKSFCYLGTKVRVVPNMLGQDDFEQATQVKHEASKITDPTRSHKLRIGWGGGIGHAGDLELLHEAMVILKDEVEWVFLGMDPDVPVGVVKFHAGIANPDRYLASLAAINVDLIVAPLEEHLFNRCKSNLRLLEAGACSYPVIASPVAPYKTDAPPVFCYANNTKDWVEGIREFISSNTSQRKSSGKAMYDWANSRFNMDTHCEKRLTGWLPENTRVFKPKLHASGTGLRIIHVDSSNPSASIPDLIDACDNSTADVLYTFGQVEFPEPSINRLRAAAADVVVPLSNDGGPWGFPSQAQFTPFDPGVTGKFDAICAANFDASLVSTSSVAGPVVLLKRTAIAAVGSPDFRNLPVEVAIMDFAAAARSRGLRVGICANSFAGITSPSRPTQSDIELATLRISGRWPQGNNDDSSLKVIREKLELLFHRDNYTKLPPQQRGDYSIWVSQYDTPGDKTINTAQTWAAERDVVENQRYPFGVSLIPTMESEWVFLHPEGSLLSPLYEEYLLDAIEKNPSAKIIYADHDHITLSGQRVAPDLKPNFDLHLLLCRDYITQAMAVRVDLLEESLADNGSIIDDSALYGLALSIVSLYGRDSIIHLPRVLTHLQPPKITDATDSAMKKLHHAASFPGTDGATFSVHPNLPNIRMINYAGCARRTPHVTLIIPCKDNIGMLMPCISTVTSMTDYPLYDILVVSNNTSTPEMKAYLDELRQRNNITVVEWNHPFNWAALNNFAVKEHAKGDFLCFLNDDTRVLSRNWLAEMVGAASIPDVGAAGARLVYPHGLIQHVGVVCHKAVTGHIHKGLPVTSPGANFYSATSHEATAVTGACMVTSRFKFNIVNGFDESFATNFNDVVFCLELRKRGFLSLLVNNAELQHFEGVTRNPQGAQAEAMDILRADGVHLGQAYPEADPYWNPNLLVASIQNGQMIAGMDLATFEFPPPPAPWGSVSTEHVLVFGDPNAANPEVQDNASAFYVSIDGNNARITHPPMQNCGPWDIRTSAIISAIENLRIDKIVLGNIGELPMQILTLVRKLGVPVIYRPSNAESVCPRTDLKTPAGSCHQGFARGNCQECLDEHGSPRGAPSHVAWLAEWFRFIGAESTVEVDLTLLQEPEYLSALEFVYQGFNEKEAAS